jgi:hypothetical protein
MTADLVIAMHPEQHGYEWVLILAFANYLGHVVIGHRLGRR